MFTTVSFMRYCKKLSILFALILVSAYVFAASSSVEIKGAELQPVDDYYKLTAKVDIVFDEAIEEAVNKGVPLNFLVEFQVVTPRKYWFDDEIVTVSTSYVLSYHALTRQYIVSHEGRQSTYETLSEARQDLMEIDDWKVLEKARIEKGEVYKAALLMRLDQNKLPQALQVEAIGSESWNLTSQKFEWFPKELNK